MTTINLSDDIQDEAETVKTAMESEDE